MSTLRAPIVSALLLLAACRPAATKPADTTPPGTPYVSPLAGFDVPSDDDPTAKEAAELSNGPLATLAQTDAADMQLEGDLIATTLGPGRVFEQEFRLVPGRCYTLLAVAGAGVLELDASIEEMSPTRGRRTVLIEDTTTGTSAVVGGAGVCFPWAADAEPLPAKFSLRVRDGEGVVVSQLYAKTPPPP